MNQRVAKHDWILWVFYCLFLAALISGLNGVLGTDAKTVAGGLGIGAVLFCLGVFLLADWSRAVAYVSRHSTSTHDASDRDADDDALRLRAKLESLRSNEELLVERYEQFQCCAEDLARARANRLEAEIELIRHVQRPKLWSEVCAEAQS